MSGQIDQPIPSGLESSETFQVFKHTCQKELDLQSQTDGQPSSPIEMNRIKLDNKYDNEDQYFDIRYQDPAKPFQCMGRVQWDSGQVSTQSYSSPDGKSLVKKDLGTVRVQDSCTVAEQSFGKTIFGGQSCEDKFLAGPSVQGFDSMQILERECRKSGRPLDLRYMRRNNLKKCDGNYQLIFADYDKDSFCEAEVNVATWTMTVRSGAASNPKRDEIRGETFLMKDACALTEKLFGAEEFENGKVCRDDDAPQPQEPGAFSQGLLYAMGWDFVWTGGSLLKVGAAKLLNHTFGLNLSTSFNKFPINRFINRFVPVNAVLGTAARGVWGTAKLPFRALWNLPRLRLSKIPAGIDAIKAGLQNLRSRVAAAPQLPRARMVSSIALARSSGASLVGSISLRGLSGAAGTPSGTLFVLGLADMIYGSNRNEYWKWVDERTGDRYRERNGTFEIRHWWEPFTVVKGLNMINHLLFENTMNKVASLQEPKIEQEVLEEDRQHSDKLKGQLKDTLDGLLQDNEPLALELLRTRDLRYGMHETWRKALGEAGSPEAAAFMSVFRTAHPQRMEKLRANLQLKEKYEKQISDWLESEENGIGLNSILLRHSPWAREKIETKLRDIAAVKAEQAAEDEIAFLMQNWYSHTDIAAERAGKDAAQQVKDKAGAAASTYEVEMAADEAFQNANAEIWNRAYADITQVLGLSKPDMKRLFFKFAVMKVQAAARDLVFIEQDVNDWARKSFNEDGSLKHDTWTEELTGDPAPRAASSGAPALLTKVSQWAYEGFGELGLVPKSNDPAKENPYRKQLLEFAKAQDQIENQNIVNQLKEDLGISYAPDEEIIAGSNP